MDSTGYALLFPLRFTVAHSTISGYKEKFGDLNVM
jgi:hypothetical protein